MNKNCEACGTPMGDVYYNRRFCYDCALERRKKQVSEINKRYRENLKKRKKLGQDKPKKPTGKPRRHCWDLENKSVTQISVEAGALGLSYGRYTSLVDTLFIEKYLASEGITDGLERIDRAWKQFKKDKRDFQRRLAARIEEEKRNQQELMEIEMGCFGEASLHTDNALHSHH